jgi:hypothetical protein
MKRKDDVLFSILHVENTIIELHKYNLPVQQIPCVNPISQKQPEEEFVLGLHFLLPHPLEQRGG